jgi:hypothetical protein
LQNGARCGCAKRNDNLGFDDGALLLESPAATLDLVCIRPLVQAAFAPHFMLEVFDRIGDEHIVTVDLPLFEGAVEDTAGRPHEGPAGFIFLSPGCSPKNIVGAACRPSPGTTCVANL